MPVYNRFYVSPGVTQGAIGPAPLRISGPTFPVEVHVPVTLANHLASQNLPIPQPVTGMALFDTGASMTCVDGSVVQSLGVAPVGQSTVYTPSGTAQQAQYPAGLAFPTLGLTLQFSSVLGAQLRNQGILVLVGRDVLESVVLTYNGPGGFVTVSF